MATTNGLKSELAIKANTPGTHLTKNEFKSLVGNFESEITAALPVHLKKNAEKYARQALTLFSQNPKLQQCTGVTILSALMTASSLGLDLTPQLGQCYIIPYDNRKKDGERFVSITEAQFQLGYRGVIALAQRSGEVTRISADVVRERDHFKYSKGLNPILEHEEGIEEDRGEITHVYAVANFKNGGYSFEVWPVAKVVAHAKKFSKSYYKDEWKSGKKTGDKVINEKSPWHTDFESMAKKTLIMAIWKFLPLSTELMLASTVDETIKDDVGRIQNENDVITIPAKNLDELDKNAREDQEPDASRDEKPQEGEGGPAPVNQDMFPFELEVSRSDDVPAAPQENPKPSANGAVSEVEKLRAELMDGLRLSMTEQESEEWCKKYFGVESPKMTTKELKAAIAKLNAEMDARDR